MPDFFKAADVARSPGPGGAAPHVNGPYQTSSGARFRADEAGTWLMSFDREGKDALDRLCKELGVQQPEDAVYTALELLAFAVDNDLDVESKNHRGYKRISGLWA
jgi:hypothetical protein